LVESDNRVTSGRPLPQLCLGHQQIAVTLYTLRTRHKRFHLGFLNIGAKGLFSVTLDKNQIKVYMQSDLDRVLILLFIFDPISLSVSERAEMRSQSGTECHRRVHGRGKIMLSQFFGVQPIEVYNTVDGTFVAQLDYANHQPVGILGESVVRVQFSEVFSGRTRRTITFRKFRNQLASTPYL
jgi:hypothetical protein